MATILDVTGRAPGKVAYRAFIQLAVDSRTKEVLGAIITSSPAEMMTIMNHVRYATLMVVESLSSYSDAHDSARQQLALDMYFGWIGPLNDRGERTTVRLPSEVLGGKAESHGDNSASDDF